MTPIAEGKPAAAYETRVRVTVLVEKDGKTLESEYDSAYAEVKTEGSGYPVAHAFTHGIVDAAAKFWRDFSK